MRLSEFEWARSVHSSRLRAVVTGCVLDTMTGTPSVLELHAKENPMSLHDRFVQLSEGRQDSGLPSSPSRLSDFRRLHAELFKERGWRGQSRTSGWRMVGMVCLAVAAAIVTFLLATR